MNKTLVFTFRANYYHLVITCLKKFSFLLLICFYSNSCSVISGLIGNQESENYSLEDYKKISTSDFSEHLEALGEHYENLNRNKILKVSKRSKKYLENLIGKITNNNELIIPIEGKVEFVIIRSKTPFYFSVPGGKVYLSVGLLRKYIKNENVLAAVATYELIRSTFNLYNKSVLIPVGYVTLPKILSLTRIKTAEKVEIYKWAFHILNRSRVGGSAVLNWIQIQNKNSYDFKLMLGNTKNISEEEYKIKNFFIKSDKAIDEELVETRANPEFYNFINEVRRY